MEIHAGTEAMFVMCAPTCDREYDRDYLLVRMAIHRHLAVWLAARLPRDRLYQPAVAAATAALAASRSARHSFSHPLRIAISCSRAAMSAGVSSGLGTGLYGPPRSLWCAPPCSSAGWGRGGGTSTRRSDERLASE